MPLLLAPLFLSAQIGQQPGSTDTRTPGYVAGRVTDAISGEGIGGASVHLFPRTSGQNQLRANSATSLDDGSFHFDSVAPGSYVLLANAQNYVMSFNRSETLTVNEGQQLSSISLTLNPLGNLSGKVIGDAGQPVGGITVELFSVFYLRGNAQLRRVQSTASNAQGGFSMSHVAPGKYYVAAGAPQDSGSHRHHSAGSQKTSAKAPAPVPNEEGTPTNFVRTFYPKATSVDGASLLELAPGASTGDVEIQLQRAETFSLRGKIEGWQAAGLQRMPILSLAPRGMTAFSGLQRVFTAQPDGSFSIDAVASGSYTLWLQGSYAGSDNRRASGARILGRQDVDVNGSSVSGLAIALFPPVNLTGRLVETNAPANTGQTQSLRVLLQPAGQGAVGGYNNAAVDAAGAFAFSDLEPGEYMVRLSGVPAGMYVQSIALNRQDVMATGMDLSQGGGGELLITLRNGAAEVDGTLTGSASQGATGSVVLIPEQIPVDGSGVLNSTLAPGGTFAVKNVPPGHYTAFAIEHWTSIWQNPDFLRSMQRDGTSVEVEENGHVQVQLPFLTVDQLQADASRVGLTVQ